MRRRVGGAPRMQGLAGALALLLAGCVYTPRTVTLYDPECRIQTRQMVLDERQVGVIGGCHNEGCVAALVVFGAVSAATAVVSGSIVVAGNVVYWFEKRSNCRPVEPPVVERKGL